MGPQAEYTDRDVEGWSIVAFITALLLFVGSGGIALTLLAMDAADDRDASNDAIFIVAGTVAAVVIINFGFAAIARVTISRRPNELKGRGLAKASDILCVIVLLNLIASVALVVLTRETEDTIREVTDDIEATTTTIDATLAEEGEPGVRPGFSEADCDGGDLTPEELDICIEIRE
jgi:heme/copper-type cytochrome/quinol oxidase subunit 2